jgi:hypothetical protein
MTMTGFRVGNCDGVGVVFGRIGDKVYSIGFISECDKAVAFTLDSRVCFLRDNKGVLNRCE